MDLKISVIMPTYKRSQFLSRAIDSVLGQTYSNIEVVVVDDNGEGTQYRTDTEQCMLKYTNNNKVLYIKNPINLGGGKARNAGIEAATGYYITFLDDDDIYLPEKVEVQVNHMTQFDLDLTFMDVRLHDSKDRLIDYRKHTYVKDTSNESLLKYHLMYHLTPTATYMFKRTAILSIGGFADIKLSQEYMLMLECIKSGMKIGYVPEAYVIQYIHEGERLSVGKNKFEGEKVLYEIKKTYFHLLSRRQIRYIKFRYRAVLLFTGIRSRRLDVAFINLFAAFFTSPLDAFSELVRRKKLIKQVGKVNKDGV